MTMVYTSLVISWADTLFHVFLLRLDFLFFRKAYNMGISPILLIKNFSFSLFILIVSCLSHISLVCTGFTH